MSVLYLIRHGQASVGAPDYDVLSPRGVEQARLLGKHFARVDRVYAGPRNRQRDTALHMLDGNGFVVDEGLDEYAADKALRTVYPALLQAYGSGDRARAGDRAFREGMHRWVAGDIPADDMAAAGTFADFVARVTRVLRGIMAAEGRGRRVAVVTSAGPVSVALQLALGLPDATVMRHSWIVANASVTELRWRDDEVTLFGWNSVWHLGDLVTYR